MEKPPAFLWKLWAPASAGVTPSLAWASAVEGAAIVGATMSQQFPRVLLTGGAGYIGSHTFVALREAGFEPVILDNFANSHPAVLERLERITGRAPVLERGDVLETALVREVLRRHRPVGVVHFAGDKAVGESVAKPLKYFQNHRFEPVAATSRYSPQHRRSVRAACQQGRQRSCIGLR